MVFGFGNKEEGGAPKPAPQSPSSPPVDLVMSMRKQGLSNNQIIQNLSAKGYDSNLVFDALNQADIKGGVEGSPQPRGPAQQNMQNPMQFPAQQPGPGPEQSPPPMGSPGMTGPGGQDSLGADQASMDKIEEIAEAIIDEKWNELVQSINKIIDWKDRTENKISQLEQQIADLKRSFDNLNQGILGKIGEYDENLSNIGSDIKAMESVFKKIIPRLTENVHSLDRIAKDMKKK
mgnify:CR=1 FL=1